MPGTPSGERHRRGQSRSAWAAVVAVVLLLALGATAQAGHLFSDVAGHTTLERVITGRGPRGRLREPFQPNGQRLPCRARRRGRGQPPIPDAQAGRADRRRSLAYVGQLTDFQLADEESPARVEFTDQEPTGFAASAWRPQEALQPFIIDWSIRQMNLFAGASPVTQGGRQPRRHGLHAAHRRPGRQHAAQRDALGAALIEGTGIDPNSGSQNPLDWDPLMHPSCAAYPPTVANLAEAAKYTGVQDYDDYDEGPNPYFYDPDAPQGTWADWPRTRA